MASEAGKSALNQANEVGETPVDMILMATNTSITDPLSQAGFPCKAGDVQQKIANAIGCGICDIQSGCSGINYALLFADSIIRSGYANRILVIGAEILTRIANYNDRTSCVLFGDGASAYVLDVSDKPGFIGHKTYGDGSKRGIITSPLTKRRNIDDPPEKTVMSPTLTMDGKKVHKEVVNILDDTLTKFESESLLNPQRLSFSHIKRIVPHQANCRTIEASAEKIAKKRKKAGFDANEYEEVKDKFIVTIDQYANSSTASQGPGLEEVLYGDNKLKEGNHILMVGFGSGFSASFNHYII